MKKFVSVLCVLLAMMMVMSGCGMLAVNEERDNEVVVATVNGEPIYKGEYKTLYEQYANYLGIDSVTASSAAYQQDMVAIRQELLDMMVEREVTWQMVEEFGFAELTAEQEAQIQENFNALIDLATPSYLVDEDGKAIENPTEEQKAAARAQVIADFGVSEEEYLETLRRTECEDALFEELTDMASVTTDEVRERYNTMVEEDQASYQGNEAEYEQAVMNGSVVLYVPAGLRYIKHILIGFDGNQREELSALREAEAFAEDPEAAALETNAKREEMAKDLEKKAQEVLDKLDAGTITFEKAMKEYSDDDQDADGEGFIIASSGESYDTEFVTHAFKVKKVGEYSDLILTDFGYHIIQYAGDVKPGPKTLDDTVKYGYDDEMNIRTMTVYEYVETRMLEEQKDTLFNAAIQLAVEDADVKTYVDRVKDVK